MNRHKINQELENRTEERDGKWVKIPISCLSYRRIRTGMWSVGEWNPVRTLSLHLFRSYFLSVDSPVNLSLNHLSGLTRLSSLVHRLNPNPEPSPSFPRLNPPPLRYATFILGLSPTALMSDRRERVDDRRDKLWKCRFFIYFIFFTFTFNKNLHFRDMELYYLHLSFLSLGFTVFYS